MNLTNRRIVPAPSFVFAGVPETPGDKGKFWKRFFDNADLIKDVVDLLREIDWIELWELIQPFFQRQISGFYALLLIRKTNPDLD